MKKNIIVNVPITNEISYSLFAQGLPTEIPYESSDKKFLIFNFKRGSVVAMFYTFANFRRAYLITSWQQKDGEKTFLPGIESPVKIIFKAKGRKIDELKHALHILTKEDHYAPFRLSIEFWEKLSMLLEYKKSYKEYIFYLYNKYEKKGKKLI